MIIGCALPVLIIIASHIFGQKGHSNRSQKLPYECGLKGEGTVHPRFAVRFYLTAMLFILFDIEVVFLIPAALIYRDFLAQGLGLTIVWSLAVFIGIVLGLALGAIPISLPGISAPVKLGLAGGPIIVGILIGTFGPRMHMITYTTRSANLMLRALGLALYLACLGLDAGAHFFETVFRPEGLLWIGTGFVLTVVPVLIVGAVAFRWMKVDFGSMAGMLCGSMANPMALNYANDTIPGDNPSVSYATVYPLSMFVRVVIAQVTIMCLMG